MEKERKKKHFISVLGTGTYQPCTYYFGDRDYDTRFVQEAVLMLACGGLSRGDRITICLTADARRRNWDDRAYSQWEIDHQRGTAEDTCQGLYSVLKNCLKNIPGADQQISIEEKDIATGKNSHEIAQMFSEIYDVINEDEEICFDITHGLRNIPMLVMTILEYARVTKKISIGGIYYGAFEVGILDEVTNKRRVPIYDLTFYHTILSWSNAANSFINYGHAEEINALVSEKWSAIARTAAKGQNLKELSGNLNNVAKKLLEFTTSVETGRGAAEYQDGIRKSFEKYEAQQKTVSEHLAEEYYPFRELLDLIEQKMEGFKEARTNFQIGMATVDWCIKNHMVQQGYTALEETLKTFLCEKADMPQGEEFWRETVVKRLCTSLYDVIEKDRTTIRERYEDWRKYVQESRRGPVKEGIEKGEKLLELIVENEEHRKLIQLMNRVSQKRNDISHFGFTGHTATAESLEKELKNLKKEFLQIQEKWDV